MPSADPVVFSVQDVADCYYQFRLPSDFIARFGLMPLQARELGITELEGHPLKPTDMLVPCLTVLPMGFSWALHWTQVAHRTLLRDAGLGGPDREWLDGMPLSGPRAGKPARLVYVDNELFVATSAEEAVRERARAHRHLSSQGLPLHEVQDAVTTVECIGLELDGIELTARASQRKRDRLRAAWCQVKRKPLMSGKQLETLLGHLTYMMLLNRPTLSCFRAVYDFARVHYLTPATLWKSCYNELRMAFSMIPPLTVRWSLPWHHTVGCSDATLFGYAVQEKSFPEYSVRAVGQWSDRWRFRWGAGDDPRARALGDVENKKASRGASAPAAPCLPAPRWQPAHVDSDLQVAADFPEVPHTMLLNSDWSLIQARRYHDSEAIHMKEGRAVLFGLRRKLRQACNHDHRHLFSQTILHLHSAWETVVLLT